MCARTQACQCSCTFRTGCFFIIIIIIWLDCRRAGVLESVALGFHFYIVMLVFCGSHLRTCAVSSSLTTAFLLRSAYLKNSRNPTTRSTFLGRRGLARGSPMFWWPPSCSRCGSLYLTRAAQKVSELHC